MSSTTNGASPVRAVEPSAAVPTSSSTGGAPVRSAGHRGELSGRFSPVKPPAEASRPLPAEE